jgi:cell division septal protein FtsQ
MSWKKNVSKKKKKMSWKKKNERERERERERGTEQRLQFLNFILFYLALIWWKLSC